MTAATVPVRVRRRRRRRARSGPSTRRSYATAWWGMVVLIMTEAMVFAILLASYFFLRASAKEWPLGGIEPPELGLVLPFSFVLLGQQHPDLLGRGRHPQGTARAVQGGDGDQLRDGRCRSCSTPSTTSRS